MTGRKRVAVLISGRGSNMAALIAAAMDPAYPASIVLVISNRPGAPGLESATAVGIETAVIDHRSFADRPSFEAALTERLTAAEVDFVCQAGFMRIVTAGFVDHWRDRLINIHPSLLPAFPGLDTHARALDAGVRLHGCTVHFVRTAVDSGPIIAQAAVPVLTDDTPDTLAARVLTAEHRLYPLALALVASQRARVVGERVHISGLPSGAPGGMLISPAAV